MACKLSLHGSRWLQNYVCRATNATKCLFRVLLAVSDELDQQTKLARYALKQWPL
jgi:hypothetical protein